MQRNLKMNNRKLNNFNWKTLKKASQLEKVDEKMKERS